MAKYITVQNNFLSVLTRKVETATVFPAFSALIKDANFFVNEIDHIPELTEALTDAFLKFYDSNKEYFDEQKVLDWIQGLNPDFLPSNAISYKEIQEIMQSESSSED
jgi:hypothetical protein